MLPKGEAIRRAVSWVSDRKRAEPALSFGTLANEATLRFDLNPLQADALLRFFREAEAAGRRLDLPEAGDD